MLVGLFQALLVFGDFDPVGEQDALDDLRQLVLSIQRAPGFLSGLDQFEDYHASRFAGQAAFGADCAVAYVAKVRVVDFL